jgi:ribosomal protein L11 methyltransferase
VPKTWTAVTVTADAELADSIGAFLLDQGAPGLVNDDTRTGVRITAHFQDEPSRAALSAFCDRLQEWFPGSSPVEVSFETTTEQDWADNWKTHFPPLPIGQRVWVHPPWISDVPADRVGVMIDPGMAFGTGHHASTRGCLTFLDRLVRTDGAQRVLDIGTGSGVLAIAAVKLGAAEVCAVDIDPAAVEIAAANAAANGVGSRLRIGTDIGEPCGPFDIVVANLFAAQLSDMAGLLFDRLLPGGVVIGAGILTTELESVSRAWEAAGLKTEDRLDESEWTTVTARRT